MKKIEEIQKHLKETPYSEIAQKTNRSVYDGERLL